jgi:hypothetical protein
MTLNTSPAVKPHCTKFTAGIKIYFHFRRILLLSSDDVLQFAMWYGIAMQHWLRANCSVHVKLRITVAQNWWFAVCNVQVICPCTLLHYSTDGFQFGLCKLHRTLVQCSTGNLQFVLRHLCYAVLQWNVVNLGLHCTSYIMWYCSAALTTCNLHCASCVIRYFRKSTGNLQFLRCKLHYTVLQYVTGDLQFTQCVLPYTVRSELRCTLRLRYVLVGLVVSIEVAVEVCLMS